MTTSEIANIVLITIIGFAFIFQTRQKENSLLHKVDKEIDKIFRDCKLNI